MNLRKEGRYIPSHARASLPISVRLHFACCETESKRGYERLAAPPLGGRSGSANADSRSLRNACSGTYLPFFTVNLGRIGLAP